jgi:hypothetical protein
MTVFCFLLAATAAGIAATLGEYPFPPTNTRSRDFTQSRRQAFAFSVYDFILENTILGTL